MGRRKAGGGSGAQVETFKYDNRIVRAFAIATVVWGLVGMAAGLLAATQLFWPAANLNLQFITFGRLRPLHTNAVIFAFVGNGMFMGIYYSLQRLCKARMFSDALSWINFWGWQVIIVSAAITLPLGFTTSKEYAELEWPIDIAIAVVWVVFTREPARHHPQAAREAHVCGHLVLHRHGAHGGGAAHRQLAWKCPASAVQELLDLCRRAGRAGAMVVRPQRRRVLPHHAVPRPDVLLPAQGGEPPGVFLPALDHSFLGADLHLHLGRAASPALHRAAGLGAIARHGVLGDARRAVLGRHVERPAHACAARGTRCAQDPMLKFMVVAVTAYGMATLEGPTLAIKSVNALSHYTDWTIAHVHTGALGWNGFLTFSDALLAVPAALQHEALVHQAGQLPFLDRAAGHDVLRRADVRRPASPRA